jgi:hypothetical protein
MHAFIINEFYECDFLEERSVKHEREDWRPPFQYLNYYYL